MDNNAIDLPVTDIGGGGGKHGGVAHWLRVSEALALRLAPHPHRRARGPKAHRFE
jgi:hypothetical protein